MAITSLAFVDSAAYSSDAELSALKSALGESTKVYVLEKTSSVFTQIDLALAALADPKAITAIHVYGVGDKKNNDANTKFGFSNGEKYTVGTSGAYTELDKSAAILKEIASQISENADFIVYGGKTTNKSSVGSNFLNKIHELTSWNAMEVYNSSGMKNAATDAAVSNAKNLADGPTSDTAIPAPGTPGWGVLDGNDSGDNATLTGGITNDILVQKAEDMAQELAGGRGNDVYYVTGSSAKIVENFGEGDDTVVAKNTSFNLNAKSGDAYIENIVLAHDSAYTNNYQDAQGNQHDQMIKGNELINKLVGGGGNNYLDAGDGDDYLDGGDGKLEGPLQAGVDFLTDNKNTLVGGSGNDAYVIRNTGDVIVETTAGKDRGGNDSIYSFIDIDLNEKVIDPKTGRPTSQLKYGNVENAALLDAGLGQKLTGSSAANILTGNSHDNTIIGGAGNDTMYGIGGNNVIWVEDAGDVVRGGTGIDQIYSNIANLKLGDKLGSISGEKNVFENSQDRYTGIEQVVIGTRGANVDASGYTANALTIQGNAGSNRIVASNQGDTILSGGGSDNVTLGAGRDVIQLKDADAGARINVTSFTAGQDRIDEADLLDKGWARDTSTAGYDANGMKEVTMRGAGNAAIANTTIRWVKTDEKGVKKYIETTLNGVSKVQAAAGISQSVIVANGATKDLSGKTSIQEVYAEGNAKVKTGTANDIITYNEMADGGSIEAGDGINDIHVNGFAIPSGGGTITLKGTSDGNIAANKYSSLHLGGPKSLKITYGASGQISAIQNGDAIPGKERTLTANQLDVTATGITDVYGTGGADEVTVSEDHTGADKAITFHTNGGDVKLTGKDGIENIYLDKLGANTKVNLDGGAGQDALYIESDEGVKVVLEAIKESGTDDTATTTNVKTLSVGGRLVSGSTIKNFESFYTRGGNDTIDLSGDSVMASVFGGSAKIGTGAGDDQIILGVMADNQAGNIHIDAGEGMDTLVLNGGSGQYVNVKLENNSTTGEYHTKTYLKFDGSSYATAGSNAVDIQNVEVFDGSANKANKLDAGGYSLKGGTLGFIGSNETGAGAGADDVHLKSVEAAYKEDGKTLLSAGNFFFDGGAGDDTVTVDNITKNTFVSLAGGTGDDEFHLGDIEGGSTVRGAGVTVDGGDGSSDALYFAYNNPAAAKADDKYGQKVVISSNGTVTRTILTATGTAAKQPQ